MIEVSGDAVALVSGDSHSRAASATLSRLRLPPAHLRAVGLAIFAAVALRLLAMCSVPLIPEEAYYWVYSQNPQLSYFDHPPMVAWVIGAGTALFGNIELGVRIGAMALMAGVSLLLYRLARMWFDRTTAIVSAVLVQILPVYFGIGLLAPMDAALCFFWLLCLVGVSAAVRSGRPGGWYLAGAALGGALLSKYSGIFLAAGVFVAVAGHPRWRRQLLTVHPYLAFALAAALFSPVMAWNASHDWASFRFQFIERYAGDRINFAAPLGFLGMQIVVLTPVPLVALGYLARRFVRQWRQRGRASVARSWSVARAWSGPRVPDRCWFAVASAVPGLAAATWTSLRSSTHINWTAPIYLAVIPAAVALVLALDRL
ncbi:MAG: glycosyltransferase family 39 protein, partial [Tepidisphaeraceae bacterium]